MKVLVVGGASQGKLEHVINSFKPVNIVDSVTCSLEDAFKGDVLNNFHILIRRLMEQDIEPVAFINQALNSLEKWIVICDEVGSGVVPINAFERKWRENVGRICCIIAEESEQVERLCCGISQRLK